MNSTKHNLQKLPADQLRRHVASLRNRITAEEDAKIGDKRSKLKLHEELYNLEQQVEALEFRKRAKIDERLAKLTTESVEIDESSLFCFTCEVFYTPISNEKFCSVEECNAHIGCPDCLRK